LYAGYVAKRNEISEKLEKLATGEGDLSSANQSYSELRGLMDGESFTTNGVYLHEWYFDILGGDGVPSGALVEALTKRYGSLENFLAFFNACGMAARGWVVLAFDTKDGKLRVFSADAHNQGGIWGAMPIIVLDVYEHAYFIDYGSDRKAYIQDFWNNFDWKKANELYEKAKR
ncbi:superoxide dismutase, partial [Patescibacteria group bacterium]|nr:superoxide dismutase [Patescibacteria group bacterium]